MKAAISIPENTVMSAQMAHWAKALILGDGEPGGALNYANANGMSDRVKAAIAPMLSGDGDNTGLADTNRILTAFMPILRNTSVFFRMLSDNMLIRLPLRIRVSYLTGTPTFTVINEAQVVKVSRVSSDKAYLEPVKAQGILVFSREMLEWLSTGGEAFLSMELRRALGAAVDLAFITLLTDGSTPTQASVGSSPLAAAIDLRNLFAMAGLKADSKPLLVASADVARAASTLFDTGFSFPEMSPTGGTMCGLPCMVADSLDAGTLALIEGTGVAADSEGAEIRLASHANVQLNDTPDSPPTASTTFVNLWQSNLVGMMPSVYFGAERLRATAFCKITGVAWGSTDSPA